MEKIFRNKIILIIISISLVIYSIVNDFFVNDDCFKMSDINLIYKCSRSSSLNKINIKMTIITTILLFFFIKNFYL